VKPMAIEMIFALCALLPLAAQAVAATGEPYPRVSEESYKARLPFFDYDTSLPLEARIVQEWASKSAVRQKIVFRGAQGFLVPGFIELPKDAKWPCPLVLLLHGWSGSKQVWWEDTGIHNGGLMRKALLKEGYAVLALDACTHGERSNEIDYMHVNAYADPNAPATHNYFTYAEIAVQTIKDYRRALDYVAKRDDIDSKRIGLVGYSMGGMDSFYLMAVEPRIKTFVACVPPLVSGGNGPASPIDYSWGAKGKSLLMLMGRKDELGDAAKVDASYHQYIESPSSKLIWYDRGHGLGPVWIPDALAWVKAHL
jgi:dienelactone hydrolase